MFNLVRKTLEAFILEKRIITQADFPLDTAEFVSKKDAIFVTLYHNGRVIASSGRIQCQKENTVYECIDNTLLCLKDARFGTSLQSAENLADIHIRVDVFWNENRRMIQSIADFSVRDEGMIFLSQNLGIMSIVLPHMIHLDPTPEKYFELLCKKAGLDSKKLIPSDYILYAFKTREYTDMV